MADEPVDSQIKLINLKAHLFVMKFLALVIPSSLILIAVFAMFFDVKEAGLTVASTAQEVLKASLLIIIGYVFRGMVHPDGKSVNKSDDTQPVAPPVVIGPQTVSTDPTKGVQP